MCKFLYTISSHANVIVERQGDLPLNAKVWLEAKKFFNASDISFAEQLIKMFGFKCKLKTYFVYELLNSRSEVCFTASAETDEEAKSLLFHIIPLSYTTSLKNPKFSDDARKVIERYETNSAL